MGKGKFSMLPTSYAKIERGGNTTVKTLLDIARVLNVNASEFFEDNHLVAEPVEQNNAVTRDEFVASNRELVNLVKNEITKLREELSLKNKSYQLRNKSRKTPKK